MSVVSMSIKGLRGFAEEQILQFAQPNGETGSGLIILVGPNNGGKSTIIESIQALAAPLSNPPRFTEGQRNKAAGDRVWIRVKFANGTTLEVQPDSTDPSQSTQWTSGSKSYLPCFVLTSRRYFNPHFKIGEWVSPARDDYQGRVGTTRTRSEPIDDFPISRLPAALRQKDKFNEILRKVIDPVPDWTIDQTDERNHYVKIGSAGQHHNSDGLGEGIVSLLFIVDSLYDSPPGDLIVIDEPELSLHPTYQRRLARLLADFAKDRQVVLATHSPYFVDFEYILIGARIARIHKDGEKCLVSELSRKTADKLKGLLQDRHNPHILGVNAREAFFQEDGVIVLEGQEDVVYYSKVIDQLVRKGELNSERAALMKDRFYGWGAGGASNIEKVVSIFRDLGFKRVAAVFDKNESSRIPAIQTEFPVYQFGSIPADDIRTKKVRKLSAARGLLDEEYKVRPEFESDTAALFKDIDQYFQSGP